MAVVDVVRREGDLFLDAFNRRSMRIDFDIFFLLIFVGWD